MIYFMIDSLLILIKKSYSKQATSNPVGIKTNKVCLLIAAFVGVFIGISFFDNSAHALITSPLSFGSRGTQVTELQQILYNRGYYYGPISGNFGNLTKAAVIKFQKASGITPATGLVGPKTRSKLNSELGIDINPSFINPPPRTVGSGINLGIYSLDGYNSNVVDGSPDYQGVVAINKVGEIYRIAWDIQGQIQKGAGILSGSTLSVGYVDLSGGTVRDTGTVSYKIVGPDKLEGQWSSISSIKTGREYLSYLGSDQQIENQMLNCNGADCTSFVPLREQPKTPPAANSALDTVAIAEEWGSSVVKVFCDAGDEQSVYTGTGTLWDINGKYIVTTNEHVAPTDDCLIGVTPFQNGFSNIDNKMFYMAAPGSFRVLNGGYDFVSFEVANYDPKWPISNLSLYAHKINSICTKPLYPVGTKVAILGYPSIGPSGGNTLSITEGIISGLEEDTNGQGQVGLTWYVTSAKIETGNSGGAAIGPDSCFIGIPTWVKIGQVESQGRLLIFTGESSVIKPVLNN